MKVSVILPVYNKERHVARAIDSILSQHHTDFELIIVDDGSTDSSFTVIQQYQDPRITFIHQKNGGPGSARNRGIAIAQGEYLAFLDADDEWLPNYLSKSLMMLEAAGDSVAAVASGYYEFPSGRSTETMWKKRGIRDGVFRLRPTMSPFLVTHHLAYMSSWCVVSRTEVIRRWGGFYDQERCLYGEDAFLWLKVLLNETILFNLTPLVCYHREASQLSTAARKPRMIEPFLEHPDEIRKACPAHLIELLDKVLSIRAIKTACALGYWGEWRHARTLMRHFGAAQLWTSLYYPPALLCATPLGGILGKVYRYLKYA